MTFVHFVVTGYLRLQPGHVPNSGTILWDPIFFLIRPCSIQTRTPDRYMFEMNTYFRFGTSGADFEHALCKHDDDDRCQNVGTLVEKLASSGMLLLSFFQIQLS